MRFLQRQATLRDQPHLVYGRLRRCAMTEVSPIRHFGDGESVVGLSSSIFVGRATWIWNPWRSSTGGRRRASSPKRRQVRRVGRLTCEPVEAFHEARLDNFRAGTETEWCRPFGGRERLAHRAIPNRVPTVARLGEEANEGEGNPVDSRWPVDFLRRGNRPREARAEKHHPREVKRFPAELTLKPGRTECNRNLTFPRPERKRNAR